MELKLIAGVDEAGRGPLAGPVMAGAVILNPKQRIEGLADSKVLTPLQREKLYERIIKDALAIGIGRAEVEEIDQINILQASLLAMQRAVATLALSPHEVLVDGIHAPQWNYLTKTMIDGDSKEPAISAASILAKVTRDREMEELDQKYPGYGFSQHKGYPTRQHLMALEKLGPCAIHRKTFAPVKNATAVSL